MPRVLSSISSAFGKTAATRSRNHRLLENPVLASRPFVIGESASNTSLRLIEYSLPALQARCGNDLFEVGKNARTNEPHLMKLNDFLAEASSEYYLFDSSYQQHEALEEKVGRDEEQQHELFRFDSTGDLLRSLPRAHRPEQSWLVIGHAGSGSFMHTDPLRTSACNELVSGEKQWLVVSPCANDDDDLEDEEEEEEEEEEQSLQDSSGKWFHDLVLCVKRQQQQQQQQQAKREVYLFTQRAGQVVYVPAGYKHAVLNTRLSIALTHNFLLSFDEDSPEVAGRQTIIRKSGIEKRRELVKSLEAHKKINTPSERRACLAALGCLS